MESIAARRVSWYPPLLRRVDLGVARLWLLAAGLVAYLAFDGGGFDIVVHSQAAIVVWWVVLLGGAWGLLPSARLTRSAWAGLGLFGGFVAWTAVASTWSLSSERSLEAVSLVAGYLGVLVLGIAVHRDRDQAVRHTAAAVASAIVLVAVAAIASRLHPGLITTADQTASYLPGTQSRLAWPLNYWNALAALLALGLPLLLALATSARTLLAQAAAAAAIPIVALCAYLTFSRGGLLAVATALVVFLALAPDRVAKLATMAVAGAASATLIAGSVHRSAVEQGLANAAARHQGATLIAPILLACAGVALAQVAIALAVRHGRRPRALTISVRHARAGLAVGVVALILVAVVAGVPGRLSHDWQTFKNYRAAGLSHDTLQRFGNTSGNGRYQYWRVAVHSSRGHLLTGNGPGTFQLLWLPNASYFSYVENAHSLYFETLAEVGLVGLALLVGFFALVIVRGVLLVVRSRDDARTRAAGATAALAAFMVSAGFDWVWQVPALPAAFLLLAAALLAPASGRLRGDAAEGGSRAASRGGSDTARPSGAQAIAIRAALIVLALACVIAVGVPLAATNAVRRSQAEAGSGQLQPALHHALTAVRVEPGAASPQIQLALVLEAQGKFPAAVAAARRGVANEPQNWGSWLVLSRLDAETGYPSASVAAYRRARALNRFSPVFLR